MAEAMNSKSTPSSTQVESNSSVIAFSWTRWLILTVISGTLFYYFNHRIEQLKAVSLTPTQILDARIGFTPDTAYTALRDMGTAGRKIYVEINKVDFIIMPYVMREFFLNTFPSKSPTRAWLRNVVFTSCSCGDFLENLCVSILLKTYPRRLDVVAWMCCVGNVVKYTATAVGSLTLVFEMAVYLKEAIGSFSKAKKQ